MDVFLLCVVVRDRRPIRMCSENEEEERNQSTQEEETNEANYQHTHFLHFILLRQPSFPKSGSWGVCVWSENEGVEEMMFALRVP